MTSETDKHAVIFGGSGFVGKPLTRALSNNGWTVTVATRKPQAHLSAERHQSIRFVSLNTFDYGAISKLINNDNTVVNLVGILNETRHTSFESAHVRLPTIIARACREKDAKRFVHVGSLGASIDAPSAYLRSKAQGEQAIMAAVNNGLDAIIIRPSIIFGANDSFTRRFQKLLRMSLGIFPTVAPNAKMQPVYIDDVVNCIDFAVHEELLPARICDVAGPEVFTLRELITEIDRMCNYRHKIIGLGDLPSKAMAMVMQYLPRQPLSPDNLLSLQVPNVLTSEQPPPFGRQSHRFKETAKTWLSSS